MRRCLQFLGVRSSPTLPRLVLLAVLGAGALGCSAEPKEADGALRGTLRVVVVEGEPGVGGPKYFLRVDDSDEVVPLLFAGTAPEPKSGTPLRVVGERQDDVLRVSSFEVDSAKAELARVQQPLVDPGTPRVRNTVLIPLDLGGGVEIANPVAYFDNAMFSSDNPGPKLGLGNNDRSMDQYYRESFFGRFQTPGETAPVTAYGGNPCNNYGSPMANALRDGIGDYDSYIWFYGTEQGSPCGGGGWGAQGTWEEHQDDAWMNGNVWPTAIPHEVGHNIGLMHASSMRCGGQRFADDPLTCETEEYGNPFTIMGNGGIGHMSAVEKWYTQAFAECNAVRVRASGTFNLLPIELPCDGIQALQVPMPKTRYYTTDQSNGNNPARFYYLELRRSLGLDTDMPAMVVIHISDEIPDPDEVNVRSAVLDMTPATSSWQSPLAGFDGLKAGETFDDPAGGVSITVDSIGNVGAVVTVTLQNGTGTNECMDGTELEGTGPDACDGTGGTSGSGGKGGSGGTGGTAGAGGSGGTSGGAGGTDSAGGSGGVAGSAGGSAAGGTGSGGVAGSAGSGSGGVASGGSAQGSAGSAPTPAVQSPDEDSSVIKGSCGCRVPGADTRGPAGPWSMLATASALVAWHRRRQRAG